MKLLLIGLFGLFLVSCSLKIPHSDGTATYLGMVRINEPADIESTVRHTRRYGLAIDGGIKNSGVLLGYQDQLKVTPSSDAATYFEYETRAGKYSGKFTQQE